MPRFLIALGAIAAISLSACGSSAHPARSGGTVSSGHPAPAAGTVSSGHPAPRAGTLSTVAIAGYAFHPPTLTVRAGTRVRFVDHDQTAHTATSRLFDTGTVAPGRSATVTFRRPGTYPYHCQFHAFMTGTITVVR